MVVYLHGEVVDDKEQSLEEHVLVVQHPLEAHPLVQRLDGPATPVLGVPGPQVAQVTHPLCHVLKQGQLARLRERGGVRE